MGDPVGSPLPRSSPIRLNHRLHSLYKVCQGSAKPLSYIPIPPPKPPFLLLLLKPFLSPPLLLPQYGSMGSSNVWAGLLVLTGRAYTSADPGPTAASPPGSGPAHGAPGPQPQPAKRTIKGPLMWGFQCCMSILRNDNVACFCYLFPPMSYVEFKKRRCPMSLYFCPPCRKSPSHLCDVEFKKISCCPDNFRGQGAS